MLQRLVIASTLVLACSATAAVYAQREGVAARDNGLPCITKGTVRFCTSDTGRVTQFGPGANYFADYEYSICHSVAANGPAMYFGSSFVHTSITQPNGAGTLPLTIVAHTGDFAWQTTTVYTVNTIDQELVASIALKRLGGPIGAAAFAVGVDDDPGGSFIDTYNRSGLSVEQTANDVMLFYNLLTRGTAHSTAIRTLEGAPTGCNLTSEPTPGGPADRSTSVSYLFPGGFASGASKTFKIQFRIG